MRSFAAMMDMAMCMRMSMRMLCAAMAPEIAGESAD